MPELIAVAPRGLEKLVAKELRALGGGVGRTRLERGRIHFEGPEDASLRANLRLRVAERILMPVARVEARRAVDLSRALREVAWERWIAPQQRVRIIASARGCKFYHTGLVDEAVREALLYRGLAGLPPDKSGEAHAPGAPQPASIDLRGTGDMWAAAIDTSGKGLHRRGWRPRTAKAPIRETLAGAVLQLLDWSGERPFVDPMCGAGTFLIEAATIALNRPPGLDRPFAFEEWPSFEPQRWDQLRDGVRAAIKPVDSLPLMTGADSVPGAVRAANGNLVGAGLKGVVQVSRLSLEEWGPPPAGQTPGLVLLNPPYGLRTARPDALHPWRDALLRAFPGWQVAVVAPPEIASELHPAGRSRARLFNGGIAVSLWS